MSERINERMNLLGHVTKQQTVQALLGQLDPGSPPAKVHLSVSLCLCPTFPSLASAFFFAGVFIFPCCEWVFFVGGESGSTTRKELGILPQ